MRRRVLAIDTASDSGSLALVEDDAIVEEIALNAQDNHGHQIYGHIESLLARHGWTIDSIDLFAAASGPGSFTGCRIGLAAMQGFAAATGRTAAGVSNLRAIAAFGTAALRAVAIDARRGEVYCAVYDSCLGVVQPETAMLFDAWRSALPEGVELLAAVPRVLAGAIGRIAPRYGVAPEANYVRRTDAEMRWSDT